MVESEDLSLWIVKYHFVLFFPQLSNSEQKWWLKFIDYGYSYHSPYVE